MGVVQKTIYDYLEEGEERARRLKEEKRKVDSQVEEWYVDPRYREFVEPYAGDERWMAVLLEVTRLFSALGVDLAEKGGDRYDLRKAIQMANGAMGRAKSVQPKPSIKELVSLRRKLELLKERKGK